MRLKKVIFLVGVMLLSFCLVGSAGAENKEGSVTFSTSSGKMWFDSDYNLQDNTQVGISASTNLTRNWGVELGLNYVDSSLKATMTGADKDVKTYFYHIDGLYHFTPEKQFVPYVAAGIGGLAFDPDDVGTENDYSFNYGGGFKIFLIENVAVRGDIRNVISWDDITDPDETYSSWLATLGVAFQFGGVAAVPPDGDADGDGVKDSMDKCPNTPPGATVNAIGCFADTDGDGVYDYLDKCANTPNSAKVDMSGCPLDTDGDGVADYMDRCPDTAEGAEIDEQGCEIVVEPMVMDSDGDGIEDAYDNCKGTPKGAMVNKSGCWEPENLQFNSGRSTIKAGSESGLDKVVEILKANPDLKLEIQGYTDSIGSLAINNRISAQRAQAVKDYLVGKGIAADRLTTKGLGPQNPIADNATREGRAENRRVELKPVEMNGM